MFYFSFFFFLGVFVRRGLCCEFFWFLFCLVFIIFWFCVVVSFFLVGFFKGLIFYFVMLWVWSLFEWKRLVCFWFFIFGLSCL